MAGCYNDGSIFGPKDTYIKFQSGDLIAVEGPDVMERLFLNDLRIPYKQILKGRVILKPGAVNVLMNFLSLGDNATFLAMRAKYDNKSYNEEDNYVQYNYFDDFSKLYSFAQLLILTGNSDNRIKQLYLTNPNSKYSVTVELLVAVIDDTVDFFTDCVNQNGLSFNNLKYTDIQTYIVNESIVIYDENSPKNALAYIVLSDINSIGRSDKILVIDNAVLGKMYLDFISVYDAKQTLSLINYVMENNNAIIQNLNPIYDDVPPVLYFNSTAGATGSTISLVGSTYSPPFNTTQGLTYSTTISLSQAATQSSLTKDDLATLLVGSVSDNRDGSMIFNPNYISVTDSNNTIVSSIVSAGTYSSTITFSDIAGNILNAYITLKITQ